MTTIIKRRLALYFTPVLVQVNIKYIVLCTMYFVLNTQYFFAQNLGVNATGATPNASSILDLNTGNTFTSPNGKGLLPPNVALTGITDAVTVTSPAVSLLVYNSVAAGAGTAAVIPGYYYWDGTKWVRLQTTAGAAQDWSLLGNAGTTAGTNFIGTTDAQDVVLKTNAVENMRILNSNGNVGINNTNPLQKLDVGGNIQAQSNPLQSSILSLDGGLELYRDPTSPVPSTSGYVDLKSNLADDYRNRLYYNNANNSFGIITSTNGLSTGAAERLTILNTSGNIGINNIAPATKLSIVATATNTGFQLQDGTEGLNKVLTSDATGKASWKTPAGGYHNKYSLLSAQTYPNSTSTQMDFGSISLPTTGYYLINFKSFFSVPGSAVQPYSYYIGIYLNGVLQSDIETYQYTTGGTYINVTDVYSITGNAGDVLTLNINPVVGGVGYTAPIPSRVTFDLLYLGN